MFKIPSIQAGVLWLALCAIATAQPGFFGDPPPPVDIQELAEKAVNSRSASFRVAASQELRTLAVTENLSDGKILTKDQREQMKKAAVSMMKSKHTDAQRVGLEIADALKLDGCEREITDFLGDRDEDLRWAAIIAAGSCRCESAIPGLAEIAAQEKAQSSGIAIKALGQIGGAKAKKCLEKIAAQVKEEYRREEALSALDEIDAAESKRAGK